jgi:broad specificity phosphatase PhoE
MRRALDTAAPIARACELPVIVEPGLHERRVGALSGTPSQSSQGVWPETLKRWLAGDISYAPEGAESFDDIRQRVLASWERALVATEGLTQVIVAHGIVCKVLLISLLPQYSLADWHRIGPVPNVGINELYRSNGQWQATRLNDVPAAVAVVS